MNGQRNKSGILIISHGSPRARANDDFSRMVAGIAARANGLDVRPAFFSIARPSIEDRVGELAAEGAEIVRLFPYFLHNGNHIRKDIPQVIERCRAAYPQVTIEVLDTFQGEPMLEEIVLDRLQPYMDRSAELPATPDGITSRSGKIIDARLGPVDDPFKHSILRRVIHSTADFSFSLSLRLHPQAREASRKAFASGRNIVCDVRMVEAGITKAAGCPIHCAIDHEDIAATAKEQGCTRAAAAMDKLAETYHEGIVAIGNAPTALWRVMKIAAEGGPRPALVVGVPVGFVGALESKLALVESGLCYVTNTSSRGGSPVAAAIVNALATYREN